jgi:hypothetical protein
MKLKRISHHEALSSTDSLASKIIKLCCIFKTLLGPEFLSRWIATPGWKQQMTGGGHDVPWNTKCKATVWIKWGKRGRPQISAHSKRFSDKNGKKQ